MTFNLYASVKGDFQFHLYMSRSFEVQFQNFKADDLINTPEIKSVNSKFG